MIEINEIMLSGGGSKGIIYIGVLKALQDLENWKIINVNLKTIKGISIGSVVGLLIIIGYTYQELKSIIFKKKLKTLKKMKLGNLINGFGLDTGDKLIKWIMELMETKHCDINITMKELYEKYNKELIIIASDLKTNQQIHWDKSCDKTVLDCIRCAITIPFVFTLQEHYVDGAVLNNFPFEFKDNNYGFVIKNKTKPFTEIQTLIDYIKSLYKLIRKRKTLEENQNEKNIIKIYNDTSVIDFDLDTKTKMELIECGYKNTLEYFFNLKITMENNNV